MGRQRHVLGVIPDLPVAPPCCPSPVATAPFTLFGAAHLGALGFTLVIAVLLIKQARRFPLWRERAAKIQAVFLLIIYPGHVLIHWLQGNLSPDIAWPCHLCDIAAILGGVALLTRQQRLAELVWFWGMAGTLNGLITPALSQSFPSFAYFSFFALHSGVVIAAIYLTVALGLRPQPGAVWRAMGWIQLYLLAAVTVNFLAGTNYGYLREKPPQASPMDFMGPWPWYILVLEGLALILFSLLYLPFRNRAASHSPPPGD